MSRIKWETDVANTDETKPRLTKTRTGMLRPNLSVTNAKPSEDDKVGPLIANAMAKTTTMAAAKQYILNSSADEKTKGGAAA